MQRSLSKWRPCSSRVGRIPLKRAKCPLGIALVIIRAQECLAVFMRRQIVYARIPYVIGVLIIHDFLVSRVSDHAVVRFECGAMRNEDSQRRHSCPRTCGQWRSLVVGVGVVAPVCSESERDAI